MVLPAEHSPTVHCRGAYLVTVLALLIVTLAPQVGAFVPAGGGHFGVATTTSAISSSCVKRTRSSQQPYGRSTAAARHEQQPVLGGGGLRRDTRRRSTPDDATVGGDDGAARDDDSSGGDVEIKDDVWAGAELPLSNNQQVEQATGALWKVNMSMSTHVKTCCLSHHDTRYLTYNTW